MNNSTGLVSGVQACATGTITAEHTLSLHSHILRYMFRMQQQTHIRNFIKETGVPFDFKKWREQLHRNGELLTSCKLYTYYRAVVGPTKPGQIPITAEDRAACLAVLSADKELVDYLRGLHKEKEFAALNTETYYTIIGAVLGTKDLQAFTRSLVSRNLRFIYTSYSISAEELVSELKNAALFALYKTYPMFGSIGQMLAISKAAMNNKAGNIIDHFTADKVAHWERGDNGRFGESREFSIQHSPEAFNILMTAEDVEHSHLSVNIDGTPTVRTSYASGVLEDIRLSADFSSIEKEFIMLLSGEYSETFSTYLKHDNVEASDRTNHLSYRKSIEKFLGLSHETSEKILAKARPLLIRH